MLNIRGFKDMANKVTCYFKDEFSSIFQVNLVPKAFNTFNNVVIFTLHVLFSIFEI